MADRVFLLDHGRLVDGTTAEGMVAAAPDTLVGAGTASPHDHGGGRPSSPRGAAAAFADGRVAVSAIETRRRGGDEVREPWEHRSQGVEGVPRHDELRERQ
jgi:hypothetical protein